MFIEGDNVQNVIGAGKLDAQRSSWRSPPGPARGKSEEQRPTDHRLIGPAPWRTQPATLKPCRRQMRRRPHPAWARHLQAWISPTQAHYRTGAGERSRRPRRG
eukprot:2858918-Pyramimonas_sp.AAC.2